MTFSDKLFIAPITTQLQNVLDAGTGTGIWAIDMGRYLFHLHTAVYSSVSYQLTDLADAAPEAMVGHCLLQRFED